MCGYFYGAYYIAHKCGLTTNTVKNQSLGSVRPYAFLSTLSVGNTAWPRTVPKGPENLLTGRIDRYSICGDHCSKTDIIVKYNT